MPLQPLNLFQNYLVGRQAADSEYQANQRNALANMEIQDRQRVNALRADPNATPEQMIRAGDAGTANALAQNAQAGLQQKQAAIQQIGGLAKQAIQSGNSREFVGAALRNPAYAQVFKAAGVNPAQIDLNSQTFDQDLQSWASIAGGVPIKPKTYGDVNNPAAGILQEDAEGNIKQVTAPQKPDTLTAYQREQLRLDRDRLNLQRGGGGEKPPAGFRYTKDGNLEFIPGGPADPKTATSQRNLRPIPAAAAQGIVENRNGIDKIQRAIDAVIANPDAFGLKNSFLPDAATQRLGGKAFSGGVDVRAKVADIGSLLIHDRSGAAVTAAEFPRLKPFIPQASDDPKTVVTKLKNLKANMESNQDEVEGFYTPDAGYRPLQSTNAAAAPPGQSGPSKGPVKVSSPAEAMRLPRGTQFVTPDGRVKVRP